MTMLSTRHITNCFVDNEFFGANVHAPLGHGKSAYAIKLIAELHGEWDKVRNAETGAVRSEVVEMNWDAWKEWLVFLPEDFLSKLKFADQKAKQQMILIWDDAGFWAANYDWQTDFGKAIQMYTNVMRSDFASLITTSPDPRWLLSHIRNLPGGHNSRVNKWTANKYQKDIRYLRMYEGWISPDLKKEGVRFLSDDFFKVRLPDDVYAEYWPTRQKYKKIAQDQLAEVIYKLREKGKEKKAEALRVEMEEKAGIKVELDGQRN